MSHETDIHVLMLFHLSLLFYLLQDHRLQRASRIGEINHFDGPALGDGSPHAFQRVIYLLRHIVILVAWRGAAGCCVERD